MKGFNLIFFVLFGLYLAAPVYSQTDEVTYFDMAYDAYEQGNSNDAIKYYTLYLEEYVSLSAYYNRGLAYMDLDMYEEAIDDFTYATDNDPEDYEAYYNRGICYYDIGDVYSAIEDYEMAIQINPEYSNAYTNLGLCNADLGNDEKAIELYTAAIDLEPWSSLDFYNRALSYQDLYEETYDYDYYDAALSDFNSAIDLNDEDPEYYWGRADLYYIDYEYDKCIEDYNKAIELDPTIENLWYNRGIAYYDNSDYENAVPDFEKAVEIWSEDIDAIWYLALCHEELGNYDQALAYYDRTVELDPDYDYLWAIERSDLELRKFLGDNWYYIILSVILGIVALVLVVRLFKGRNEEVVRQF